MTRKIKNTVVVKHVMCAVLALFGASVLYAAEIAVSDFSTICGWSTNAVVCAVGDTVTLPTLAEGEYTNNNPRVASLSGNVVTALEPGFTGVVNPSSAVGGIIVLPAVGGAGRVFVAILDTDKILGHVEEVRLNWCDENNWRAVDGGSGYPNAADDVAMIPIAVDEGSNNASQDYSAHTLAFAGEITIGQIFIGSFKNTANTNIRLLPSNDGDVALTFRRTDGISPLFAITGSGAAGKETWIRVKKSSKYERKLSLNLSAGLKVDLGYTGSGKAAPHVFFKEGSLNLPEGRRLVFVNGRPDYSGSAGTDSGIQFEKGFVLGGAGTIRNDSDMNMRVDSEGDAIFAGLWESGGVRPTSFGGTDAAGGVGAGVDLRKATAAGRTVLSEGGIKQGIHSSGYSYFQDNGCRGIKIGTAVSGSTGLDFYTDRIRSVGHVILNSGLLGIFPERGGGNGNADIITTRVDRLTFGFGLSKLNFFGAPMSETAISSNFVHVVSVVHGDLAQSDLYMSDLYHDNLTTGSATDRMLKVKFDDLGNQAIGGVVPWMMGVCHKRYGFFPPMIDENGYIYYDMPEKVDINAASPEAPFVRVSTHALSADKTLNAVYLASMGSDASTYGFGGGRTLTVASGAVFLEESCFVGDPNYEAGAGTLAFDAPGYVYTKTVASSLTKRPRIHSSMAAPQGVAFAGLADCGVVLTGDKTGIKKELVVNGTTVILGTETTAANLDVDIRVAGGFSVLDVQNVNADFLKKHTLTLQDSGHYPAKVNLADGTYRVRELYVGGKPMKSGTYGSSSSAAANVDDDHFSGSGMVEVTSGAGLSIFIR